MLMFIKNFISAMLGRFIWLNKQGVKSSKGFIVQSVSRHYFEYKEDKLTLSIEVESGQDDRGRYNLAVYAQNIENWDPPYDNEAISSEKKKEIIKNIGDALDFMRIGYTIYEK